MQSLFDNAAYDNIVSRMQRLSADSPRKWGKLSIGQMLHHLNLTLEAPLGKYKPGSKGFFLMRIFKSALYNDKPWNPGGPTAPAFKIKGEDYDFATEKDKALRNLGDLYKIGMNGPYPPHVFFGPLTPDQWGRHFFKHTDHHLKQFGL